MYVIHRLTTYMWSLCNIFLHLPAAITPFVTLSADQSIVQWACQLIVSSKYFNWTISTLFFQRDDVFYLLCTRAWMVLLLRNTHRRFWHIDWKNPTPLGGFSIYYVLWSRAVCKRFHDEMRPSHLVVKSLTHGSWSGNIINRKPPRGGWISFDQHRVIHMFECMCEGSLLLISQKNCTPHSLDSAGHSHPGRIWIDAHRSRACRRWKPRSLIWSVCTHRRRLPIVVTSERFVSVWAIVRNSRLFVCEGILSCLPSECVTPCLPDLLEFRRAQRVL